MSDKITDEVRVEAEANLQVHANNVLIWLEQGGRFGASGCPRKSIRALAEAVEEALSQAHPTDEEKVERALSVAFGEPVDVPAGEFLERSLAGMFRRQPDMSGDQRKRLNGNERRAVEDMAGNILAALNAIGRKERDDDQAQDTV